MHDRFSKPAQWIFRTFRFSPFEKKTIKEWELLGTFQWSFPQVIAKTNGKYSDAPEW